MFIFQHSQITQNEFEKNSQTVVEISNSLCNIHHYSYLYNLTQFSKNQKQAKYQYTYIIK